MSNNMRKHLNSENYFDENIDKIIVEENFRKVLIHYHQNKFNV
jgi:hypothetical protein